MAEWTFDDCGVMHSLCSDSNNVYSGPIGVDVTTLTNDDNRQLLLANNYCYWSKNMALAITYEHRTALMGGREFPVFLNTTLNPQHPEPGLFVWLCDRREPLVPLGCARHPEPLVRATIRPNGGKKRVGTGKDNRRLTFFIECTSCCHACPNGWFGLTVLQYLPAGCGVLWNCVAGEFRGGKHIPRKKRKTMVRESHSDEDDMEFDRPPVTTTTPPPDDPRVDALLKEVDELRSHVDSLRRQVGVVVSQMNHFKAMWSLRYT